MTEETTPLASTLLAKAVKELNETDATGAVGQMKTLIKLVQTNDKKVVEIQKSTTELLKQLGKLSDAGGLTAERFA